MTTKQRMKGASGKGARCGNCAYWMGETIDSDTMQRHDEKDVDIYGECHINPPVIPARQLSDDPMSEGGYWPRVHTDNWCGMWIEDEPANY